jgi:hypothetical protein
LNQRAILASCVAVIELPLQHMCTVVHALHSGFAMELLSDATGSVPYVNCAGQASAEEIHRILTIMMQSPFAAVLKTEEWLSVIKTGEEPERDTIYGSNQRARLARQKT